MSDWEGHDEINELSASRSSVLVVAEALDLLPSALSALEAVEVRVQTALVLCSTDTSLGASFPSR